MARRLLIFGAVSLGLAGLALATLPWWWGAALRTVGGRYGVTLGDYQRIGYARWAIADVVVTGRGWAVRADRVEADQPLRWLIYRSSAGPVRIGEWRIDLEASREPKIEGDDLGWQTLLAGVQRGASIGYRWLPPTEAGGGLVARGTTTWVTVGAARYSERRVVAEQVRYRFLDANVELSPVDDAVSGWHLRAVDSANRLRLDAVADTQTLALKGDWREQPWRAKATFGEAGWVPRTATFDAQDWRLPGADFGLKNSFEAFAGSTAIVWENSGLKVQLHASGLPVATVKVPTLVADFEATGDLSQLTISQAHFRAPGIVADLDEPISIDLHTGATTTDSVFRLQADLAEWPESILAGVADGRVTVKRNESGWPTVAGGLQFRDGAWKDFEGIAADLVGELTWPSWQLSEMHVVDKRGTLIDVTGSGNAADGVLAEVDWSVALPADYLSPWLPNAVKVGTIGAHGALSGPWKQLQHRGTIEVQEVTVGAILPMVVAATWTGEGERAAVEAEAKAGDGRVHLSAHLDAERLVLNRAELRHADASLLSLSQPTEIVWKDGLQLRGVTWVGPLGQVAVSHFSKDGGQLTVDTVTPDLGWLQDWWAGEIRVVKVDRLALEAEWSEAKVSVVTDLAGQIEMADLGLVDVAVKGRSGANTTEVELLSIGRGETRFAAVAGRLPVGLTFVDGGFVPTIDESGAIDANVAVSPNPEFWRAVGTVTGITISRPDITIDLAGTWQRPRGAGHIAIGSIRISPERGGGREWPMIENLRMTLQGDGDGLAMEGGSAQVEGQEIRMSGQLPLTQAAWTELKRSPLAYLRERGEAKISIPRVDMAAVAKFVPDYLVAAGTASVALSFSPGGLVDGGLNLTGAVSRPLGPLGVLQEVQADIEFSGRKATLKKVQALMGGQPVTLTGDAIWADSGRVKLNLNLRGSNLPLIRRTGLLLRADINLLVTSDASGAGAIGGTVKLRDGLMLADIRSLVPTGGGANSRQSGRPPYFSVEFAPFSEWRLGVDLSGERFMRMQTPVLTGSASIDLRLDGTLRNPRAIGEVTVDEGQVRLPFARFQIEEAYARLTTNNPYEPRIFLHGTGKRLGYDLTMDLTGTASSPRLSLASDPTLPAADVVLLVMAGVAPRDEVSYSASDRALQLGVYLGQEIFSGLLGTDGGDRLTVTTGERLSRQGRETLRMGYELTDRWSITGEYDEFDYYNVGLKWRWLPRPEPKQEAEADAPN